MATVDERFYAKRIGMIREATSNDDSPIPGYLYTEINGVTFESPKHCALLMNLLVNRIQKPECHIKYKALKLTKYLVQNGDPTFKFYLRQNSQCIQEATKFGGPPDPVHGNLPYLVVRKIAKELCELVFDVAGEPSAQTETSVSSQRIVGIGSSQSSAGGKYLGFGNTSAAKKSLGHAIRDGLEYLAEHLVETPAQRQAALLAQLENSAGDYVPPVVAPVSSHYHPEVSTQSQVSKKAVPKHVPGRAGGGWEEDSDLSHSQVSGSHSEGSGTQSDGMDALSAPDWSAEEQLVKEYLMLDDRSHFFLLRPSQLKSFRKQCQGLNCEKIVQFTANTLKSTDNYAIVRALLLLETFFLKSSTVSLDDIVSMCQEQLVDLAHNNADERIQNKALKLIRGLECYSSSPNILEGAAENED